jgi:hypothetical protein
VEDTRNISGRLRNGISEIESGSKEILQSTNDMSELASRTQERMLELHRRVASFRVAEGNGHDREAGRDVVADTAKPAKPKEAASSDR